MPAVAMEETVGPRNCGSAPLPAAVIGNHARRRTTESDLERLAVVCADKITRAGRFGLPT